MPSYMAGVEGFEPPNGGIKTRHNNQHNQQVTEITGRLVPLHTLRVPIAATKPATWDWETAAVPGPTRGTMNHSRLWANSGRPYGHLLRYASLGARASAHRPGNDPRQSRNVALRLKQKLLSRPSVICLWSV
jgi:hypothetical protein